MKKIDARMDLLRVAGAFAVVWLHVSADVVVKSPDVHSLAWWAGNLLDALSRWSVPIFVMVSGALLLSGDAEIDLNSFYRRRAARLIPPLVFWTAFYILLEWYAGHGIDFTAAAKNLYRGMPYNHLWYLYMIIGLYLAAPFLHKIVIASSERALLLFVSGAFVISAIETAIINLTGDMPTTFLSSFLPYVAYFVAGRYLYLKTNSKSRMSYLLLAGLCGVLVACGTGALLAALGSKAWIVMYSNLDPIVILMSLCVFRYGIGFQFRSEKVPVLLRRIAPITLGIYLIHPFWLIVLSKFGLTPFFVHPIVGIPLMSLAAFGLSALSAGILATIPILKTTVK